MATPLTDFSNPEAYYDYGLDYKNRRVFLTADVDENPISHVIKGLLLLSARSDESIELVIGSFGGCEYEMFGLYDVMQTIPCPISTMALGKCMSAAPLLVAAGEPGQRFSYANTQWMVHMGWGALPDQRWDELRKFSTHVDMLGERWYNLMSQHSKKSAAQWKQICRRVGDFYFSAEQALALGLIDEVWS